MSAARAYPLKYVPEVKIEVNVAHAPANTLAKKAVSVLDSRNLNADEKGPYRAKHVKASRLTSQNFGSGSFK